MKLPGAAGLTRPVGPAERDHHSARGKSLSGCAGASICQHACTMQQPQEGGRDRRAHRPGPQAAQQPPPKQQARPGRAVRRERLAACGEEACVQERHLLERSGQPGRIAPGFEVRQFLLRNLRESAPLDRPQHEADQLDFGSRRAEDRALRG